MGELQCSDQPMRPSDEGARDVAGQRGEIVKKGRHRRFEEARSLKRSFGEEASTCAECGAEPDDKHATWCLAEEDAYDRILGAGVSSHADEHDPLDDERV